jgi:hypothetical protein
MSERIPTVARSSNDDKAGRTEQYLVLPSGFTVPGSYAGLKLLSLMVHLKSTCPQSAWVMLLSPSGGVVPVTGNRPTFPSIPLAAGQYASLEIGAHGIDFDTLTVALSSTEDTLTTGLGLYLEVYAVILG